MVLLCRRDPCANPSGRSSIHAGREKSMVMSPFKIGKRDEHFGLLLVDESHRLWKLVVVGSTVPPSWSHSSA